MYANLAQTKSVKLLRSFSRKATKNRWQTNLYLAKPYSRFSLGPEAQRKAIKRNAVGALMPRGHCYAQGARFYLKAGEKDRWVCANIAQAPSVKLLRSFSRKATKNPLANYLLSRIYISFIIKQILLCHACIASKGSGGEILFKVFIKNAAHPNVDRKRIVSFKSKKQRAGRDL